MFAHFFLPHLSWKFIDSCGLLSFMFRLPQIWRLGLSNFRELQVLDQFLFYNYKWLVTADIIPSANPTTNPSLELIWCCVIIYLLDIDHRIYEAHEPNRKNVSFKTKLVWHKDYGQMKFLEKHIWVCSFLPRRWLRDWIVIFSQELWNIMKYHYQIQGGWFYFSEYSG